MSSEEVTRSAIISYLLSLPDQLEFIFLVSNMVNGKPLEFRVTQPGHKIWIPPLTLRIWLSYLTSLSLSSLSIKWERCHLPHRVVVRINEITLARPLLLYLLSLAGVWTMLALFSPYLGNRVWRKSTHNWKTKRIWGQGRCCQRWY